jgi:hypothetical protein
VVAATAAAVAAAVVAATAVAVVAAAAAGNQQSPKGLRVFAAPSSSAHHAPFRSQPPANSKARTGRSPIDSKTHLTQGTTMAKTKPSSRKAATPAGKYPGAAPRKEIKSAAAKTHTQRIERQKAK